MHVALITGDRNWNDAELIYDTIAFVAPDYLIEGEARGADSIGRDAARALGITVIPYPALWETEGRAAGPLRNIRMLDRLKSARDHGHVCTVLAFHDDLEHSKGTRHMVGIARAASFVVNVYSH